MNAMTLPETTNIVTQIKDCWSKNKFCKRNFTLLLYFCDFHLAGVRHPKKINFIQGLTQSFFELQKDEV